MTRLVMPVRTYTRDALRAISLALAAAVTATASGCDGRASDPGTHEHTAVTSIVRLSSRDAKEIGIASVAVEQLPRSHISTPIRLSGVTTDPEAGTAAALTAGSSGIILLLPQALAPFVRPGELIPIVDAATAAALGVGTVRAVGEEVVGGAVSAAVFMRIAASLTAGRLVVGSLAPATDAAQTGLGNLPVVLLPEAAFMGTPLRAFIFVQQDSVSFVQRRVMVEHFVPSGSANPGTTTVIAWSGVRSGERVVVRGVDSLLAIFSRAVLTDEDQHERLRPPP